MVLNVIRNKDDSSALLSFMKQILTILIGHNGWVTSMEVGATKNEAGEEEDFLVTGSRDQNVIYWQITEKKQSEDNEWGIPKRVLSGHSHFIEDLALSIDSRYALTASWDKTLRLWDLTHGKSTHTFVDHTKDALTCSFSADNRLIASGARDKNIKIWNTVAECKFTVEEDSHSDWVSTVRFSPDTKNNILVTGSWDGTLRVWDSQTMTLQNTFVGHTNAITSVAFAQKAVYLASGGRDGNIILWNVEGSFLKNHEHSHPINQVLFSKTKYWIAAAADDGILIWDLYTDEILTKIHVHVGDDDESESDAEDSEDDKAENKEEKKVTEKKKIPCLSIAWSKKGHLLYSGWADNTIRVYEVLKP